MQKVKDKMRKASLPCEHPKKTGDVCDADILWLGIEQSGSLDPRFWTDGKKFYVTVTCLSHSFYGDTVEVADHKDAMECLAKAYRLFRDGGKLSCGCKVSND